MASTLPRYVRILSASVSTAELPSEVTPSGISTLTLYFQKSPGFTGRMGTSDSE